MRNILTRLSDIFHFIIHDSGYWLSEKIFYLKYGLSAEDRKTIYLLLSKALNDSESKELDKLFEEISLAKQLAGDETAAYAYTQISENIKKSGTGTPISDAFEPFIPWNDYESMRVAEIAGESKKSTLREALPFIQVESIVRSDFRKIIFKKQFLWISRIWLPTILLYPNLSQVLIFVDPTWGRSLVDPTYRLWSSVESISGTVVSVILSAIAIYSAFYFIYRSNEATEARRFWEMFPLFNDYKMTSGSSAMVSVAVQLKVSTGTNIPNIISSVSNQSNSYSATYLDEFAEDSKKMSFKDALANNGMINGKLKSELVMSNIFETDDEKIVTSVTNAVVNFLDRESQKLEILKGYLPFVSMLIIGVPIAHVMWMSTMAMLSSN
ncbi:hypothetical protein [Marinomonas sp. 2405UD68-3]|uniref:hypothetical protein n=1 Tax=Marinomonas sp. 2405UD68-3 TaxID=3391835 RepID=UPI0039C9823F